MRKSLIILVFTFSFNVFSQGTSPVLSNFRIENSQPARVYFDSSKGLKGSSTKGFIIIGKKINTIKINTGQTSGHYLTVSTAFTFWDNNTIRYEGGGNLQDSRSNPLSDFTLQYIVNDINEPDARSNTYYVSVAGNDNNKGTSESSAWRTISKAASSAKSGSTVWIKAGNYVNENVVVKHSGKINDPIKFLGYRTTPGDNPSLVRSQTTNFSASQMPYILTGSSSGSGFNLSGKKHIIVKNIQVEGYQDGVILSKSASYNMLENVYVKGAKRMGFNGFSADAINNRFKGCYAANTSETGIRISGERHLIEDFYASSKGVQSMDYYISIYGGAIGTGTIIRNSSIVRDPLDTHTGHGISIKADGKPLEHTLIENCVIDEVAQAVELRHHQVKYTIVRNVKATGNRDLASNLITFRDDTNHNTIENCTAIGVYEAIRFAMNKGEDLGIQGGGHHNKIINTVFDNCKFNISITGFGGTPKESTYNEFLNCTFYDSNFMFALPINFGKTNKFTNCIIEGVEKNVYGSGRLSAEFTYSNFYGGYSKPSGTGNISVNSAFENSSNGNFKLKKGSPLIDKGKRLDDVTYDFGGSSRPQGSSQDIGAFEFSDDSTDLVNTNTGEN